MPRLLFVLLVLAFWGCFPAHAVYSVGDAPGNVCWSALDVPGGKACLFDAPKHGFAQVLLFNAGWCGPCNDEFRELVPALERFTGKSVTFISLSSGSFGRGDPDERFLCAWESKFAINKTAAYWLVAASPRNSGKDYFSSPSIPNVVIIDAKGKVFYKAINPGVRAIVKQVEAVLSP